MSTAFDPGRTAAAFPHRRFWAVLEERHPEERARRVMNLPFFWQRSLPDLSLVVTLYVAPEKNRCGVFLGKNERLGATNVAGRLQPHAGRLSQMLRLDPALSSPEFPFVSRWNVNCFAEDNWPAMSDWLATEAGRYERALVEILKEA